MTSKMRIRVGEIEVEYEGSEEFIKAELPALMEHVAKLQRSLPTLKAGGGTADESEAGSMSCTTIAQKLNAKKSPLLMMAAALKLTLANSGKEFTKSELREMMKSAIGFYKSSFANNFDATLQRAVTKGEINHSGGENYSLPISKKEALITQVLPAKG